jgi:hypothetical protein
MGPGGGAVNVLLVDVDSKIPNLALMKLSAWHKAHGDIVGFNVSDPDVVYASVIFKKNKHLTDGLRMWYPNAEIHIGGSGTEEYSIKLSDEIERIRPDYDLYPYNRASMGFTTRGCIRSCYFCVVPSKEGELMRWQHPSEFYDPRFNNITLLDNNWMADREWFFETSNWIIDKGLLLHENGLDIRLLDDELATQISRFKLAAPLKFAYDSERDTQAVLDGIDTLNRNGISTRNRVLFYVYCHDDKHYENALERCRLLKEHKAGAFVMYNIDRPRTKRIKHLQRWANRPWLFWSIDLADYGVKA